MLCTIPRRELLWQLRHLPSVLRSVAAKHLKNDFCLEHLPALLTAAAGRMTMHAYRSCSLRAVDAVCDGKS